MPLRASSNRIVIVAAFPSATAFPDRSLTTTVFRATVSLLAQTTRTGKANQATPSRPQPRLADLARVKLLSLHGPETETRLVATRRRRRGRQLPPDQQVLARRPQAKLGVPRADQPARVRPNLGHGRDRGLRPPPLPPTPALTSHQPPINRVLRLD